MTMRTEPGIIKKLDEAVVNRIAAGEVIQRPANALKELLENSLDAGCTNVTVVVSGGGLQMLQITDNGTGIRKEDLGIVCERFTTSKLRNFNDLSNIATYGFRGEALASISHVAKVTILTKTQDQTCGYKVEYKDGKPLLDKPKACAANQGTQITVEDLFYNVPTRKRVLKSPSDEFKRITDVMTKYAIHNSGKVGLNLKKIGETEATVGTQKISSIKENVAHLYSSSIARELLEFNHNDDILKFKAHGYMTNANYNVKKMTFLLFINHRLVESSALKKTIELVYAAYLPKGTHPFVYLSLEITPENIDVNVHPTKQEVIFLHQEDIIDKLQSAMDARLLGSNQSRTFYTQPVLPGAPLPITSKDFGTNAKAEIQPKNMVRTDPKVQKLDKFLTKSSSVDVVMKPIQSDNVGTQNSLEQMMNAKGTHNKNMEEQPMDSEENNLELQDLSASTALAATKEDKSIKMSNCKLLSVKNLRKEVDAKCHPGLRDLIVNHTFVGCADRDFALIQHETKLYAVNIPELTKHLFYQLMLIQFQSCDMMQLKPAPKLFDLIRIALESPDSGWTETDGDKDELAKNAVRILSEKVDLLDDYFSIQISNNSEEDGGWELSSIPILLEGFSPDLNQIPIFALKLAVAVEWTEEVACLDSLCTELAEFYHASASSESNFGMDQHEDTKSNFEDSGDEIEGWKSVMEQIIFPAMKKFFKPPESLAQNKTFHMVADLPALYRVFERC